MNRRDILRGAVAFSVTAPTAIGLAAYDPLLNAIKAFHAGCAAYSADSAEYEERGEEGVLVEATYGPPMKALCNWDTPAQSPASAIEALKLIKSEKMLIDNMGEAMIDAAIGFLEALPV